MFGSASHFLNMAVAFKDATSHVRRYYVPPQRGQAPLGNKKLRAMFGSASHFLNMAVAMLEK